MTSTSAARVASSPFCALTAVEADAGWICLRAVSYRRPPNASRTAGSQSDHHRRSSASDIRLRPTSCRIARELYAYTSPDARPPIRNSCCPLSASAGAVGSRRAQRVSSPPRRVLVWCEFGRDAWVRTVLRCVMGGKRRKRASSTARRAAPAGRRPRLVRKGAAGALILPRRRRRLNVLGAAGASDGYGP